ncbi:MAG TPA: UDP-N-acetylmuramoyl-L-alanyl-D-glutamate--2,6-diaminopimelate ligase [Chloroflexota bacterium]|nr:UDP-N-acetylmuramoyl-L-alanyl-D-glutamate--2,6-diaminopimelate ligase [Chloroflexota bacterium]
MRSKTVAELLSQVPHARLASGDAAAVVSGVTQDTRQLRPGDLFVAVMGFERNGLDFAPEALVRGAPAVVSASRTELADLAAAFYDRPSTRLPVVGVTGTDGKTSTTHLLSAILEAHGLRTGWLTTVNTRIGAEVRPNAVDHTTPEAPLVQRTLAEMLSAGVDVGILETSSHALALDRVHAVNFRVGVLTNLSPEHINFHRTLDAYRSAKARLFSLLPSDGLAVLNADDANVGFFASSTSARVLRYGLTVPADLLATDVALSPRGTSFTLDSALIKTRLLGRFNVANWLAAYAAATFFGATIDDLRYAALAQGPVPGRMNVVDQGQPFTVVVDFAHTPQALERALDSLRELGARRVLLVFGLAGGRDAANRPVMGDLAERKSDFFVISTDDPGHEDPFFIAQQIASGAAPSRGFVIELDRRAAIRLVLERAEPGDAVLLAGKGHEQRMVVGDERRPWNDAAVAAELLTDMGYTRRPVP